MRCSGHASPLDPFDETLGLNTSDKNAVLSCVELILPTLA